MATVNNPLLEALNQAVELPNIEDEKVYLLESEFRGKWLNMFIGYFIGDKDAPIDRWVDTVSGNHYREVHVVTNLNDPDNTLQFIVPPIFSRDDNLYNVDDSEVDVNTVLNLANLNNRSFPGSGNNIIAQGILGKIKEPTPSLVETERWRAIYSYYNIDAPFVKESATNAKQAPNAQTAEVVGFDDDF